MKYFFKIHLSSSGVVIGWGFVSFVVSFFEGGVPGFFKNFNKIKKSLDI